MEKNLSHEQNVHTVLQCTARNKNIKKLQIKLKHLLHSNSVVSTCGMNFWRVIWVTNTAVCESKVVLYIMEVLGRRGGIAPHPLPLH
jgi:hypothetical protein